MFIPLPNLGLIKISGDQAKQFLQGQFTCNLAEIDDQHSRLGAYCDYKGRMFADFRLYYLQPDYYLLLNKSLSAKVLEQLQKYAVFSKVSVSCSEEFTICGYLAEENISTINNFGEVPQAVDEVVIKKDFSILRVPGLKPRYVIIIKQDRAVQLNLSFTLSAESAIDRWQLANIMAGIPSLYPQTSDIFTPHMLNYHLINGISFSKGCYVGQEIISRTQHLGKLKRHMYRMQITSNHRPQPGDTVFHEQQEVGTVVDASPDPTINSGYQLLAVLHDAQYAKKELTLAGGKTGNDNPVLMTLDLPYKW